MILFKNQLHAPLCDASLSILPDDRLLVSNIGSSGLDGVIVVTQDYANWEMTFEPLTIDNDNLLNMTLFGRDGYNRIKALAQHSIIKDSISNETRFCFNTKLLAKCFKLVGKIGDTVTFEQQYHNPTFPPQSNWIGVAIAVTVFVLSRIDYKKKVTKDGNGKVIKTEETYSWNSVTQEGTPDPRQFTTFDGQIFQADNLYIQGTFDFSGDPLPPILENKACMVQLTGRNLPSLTIIDYALS